MKLINGLYRTVKIKNYDIVVWKQTAELGSYQNNM